MAIKFAAAHFTEQEALQFHSQGKPGKLEITSTKSLTTQRDLTLDRLRHRRETLPQREALRSAEADAAKVQAELDRVAAARDAIGSDCELFVDANGAYSRKLALEQAEHFSAYDVRWFEEPVSSDDLEGLRLMRDRGPAGMDIAAGEYGYDLAYFRRMLEAGAVDKVASGYSIWGWLDLGQAAVCTRRFVQACFAAGMKVDTAEGFRKNEEIREGDFVLSRDENDSDGAVVAKLVEEVFVRTGRIFHLHLGGKLIRTTPEHLDSYTLRNWVCEFEQIFESATAPLGVA